MTWPFKRKAWESLGRSVSPTEIFLQASELKPEYIFFRDRDYRAIPRKDFEALVFDSWFLHDLPNYKSDIWDCDDFAVQFVAAIRRRWAKVSRGVEALTFGYIEAQKAGAEWHSFVWFLDDKGEIHFYEPQTGKRAQYKIAKVRLIET